jgi:hypothetical protein
MIHLELFPFIIKYLEDTIDIFHIVLRHYLLVLQKYLTDEIWINEFKEIFGTPLLEVSCRYEYSITRESPVLFLDTIDRREKWDLATRDHNLESIRVEPTDVDRLYIFDLRLEVFGYEFFIEKKNTLAIRILENATRDIDIDTWRHCLDEDIARTDTKIRRKNHYIATEENQKNTYEGHESLIVILAIIADIQRILEKIKKCS